MEGFLFQATIYLAAAVIAVPIASRLGLGSVLGYLAAGILIGPLLGLVGSETKDLQHFAEFGVVMMLFLIGLELEPRALWDMRNKLLGLGGLQVALSALALMGIAMAYDQPWNVALAIGLTLALSSTAIVLQTLSEKNLMQTGGGRSVFSVLLTQDIAVIPILAFLPLLAIQTLGGVMPDGSISLDAEEVDNAHNGEDHHGPAAAEAAFNFIESLPGWGVTLVTLGAVASIIVLGVFFTRPVFRFIHSANLREMYTAIALLIVTGISFLMILVGLSPALGAFLAGVVLASSEFRHELETDLEPFKGLLLGLFFITVGAGINFELLFADTVIILGMALLVIIVKGLILYALALAFRIKGRDRWLFTLSLAQAGEFGFVLASFSVTTGAMPNAVAETLLLVIALSMLITPLLFILYEVISRRMEETGGPMEPDEIDEEGPVIIAGIGRFGQIVNRLVQASGFQTVVLDHNPETIAVMRRFGFKAFLGDPTRPDILRKAGLSDARVLVVALDDQKAALELIAYARKQRPDLHIITRAHDRTDVYRQFQAGADDIVREMFDSSLRSGRYVLERMGLSEFEAHEAERMFYDHDRMSVRELAGLWRPDVEPSANKEYVARAKELQKDLETAFLNREEPEEKKRA